MPRAHPQYLAAHLGDEIETAGDDDEVLVGRAFSRVCERRRPTRVFVGDAAVTTNRVGDLARGDRSR